MRAIYCCICLAGLALGSPGAVMGQSLLEHATAAAGGAAAGVAAGPLNQGMRLIFRKLDKQGKRAAAVSTSTAKKKNSKKKKAKQAGRRSLAAKSGKGAAVAAGRLHARPARRRWVRSHRQPRSMGAASIVSGWAAALRPPPPRPRITKQDLARVTPGISRRQLFSRLGPPAARVLIPEEDRLREIDSFVAGGKHLGWVRLVNGAVNGVQLDPES